jgi:multiple sugar transport system ATP-binding protein
VTEQLGSEVDVIFRVTAPRVQHQVMVAQFDKAATDKEPAGQEQAQTAGLVGEDESLWTAKVNPKTGARPGRAIDLAVDTSALYWFDPTAARRSPGRPPATGPAAPRTRQKLSPDGPDAGGRT